MSTTPFKALLIGINNYSDEALKLESPARNVDKLGDFLIKHTIHFSDEDITARKDLKKEEMLEALYQHEDILSDAKENGLYLFFFSGHGEMLHKEHDKYKKRSHYLLPADCNSKRLYQQINSSVNTQELIDTINDQWSAHKRLFIIDACYSGHAKSSDMSTTDRFSADDLKHVFKSNDPATVILSSSMRESQAFYEDEQGNRSGYSLFVHFLVKVVEDGMCDPKHTGRASLLMIKDEINKLLQGNFEYLKNLYDPENKKGISNPDYWACKITDPNIDLANEMIFRTKYYYELPEFAFEIEDLLDETKLEKLKDLNQLIGEQDDRAPSFWTSLEILLDKINNGNPNNEIKAQIQKLLQKAGKRTEEKREVIVYDAAYVHTFNILFYSINNTYEENEIIYWINSINESQKDKLLFIQLFIYNEENNNIRAVNTNETISSLNFSFFDLGIIYFNEMAPVVSLTITDKPGLYDLRLVSFMNEMAQYGRKVLLFKTVVKSTFNTKDEVLDNQKVINKLWKYASGQNNDLFSLNESENGLINFDDYSTLILQACKEKLNRIQHETTLALQNITANAEKKAILDSYISWVIRVYEDLEIRGVENERKKIPLVHVYVELKGDLTSAYEKNQEFALTQNLIAREMLLRGNQITEDDYRFLVQDVLSQHSLFYTDNTFSNVKKEPEVVNLAEAFQKERCLVILGDPGSGKTTLVMWLALHLAKALEAGNNQVSVKLNQVDHTGIEKLTDEEEETENEDKSCIPLGPSRLPVLLRIAEYAQELSQNKDLQIIDFLGYHTWMGNDPFASIKEKGASKATLNEIIKDYIKKGEAVIFLDGLDEIPNFEDRHEIVNKVMTFISEHLYPKHPSADKTHEGKSKIYSFRNYYTGTPVEIGGNQIIITSRIAGYHEAPITNMEMSHLTIEPMQKEAIIHFCRLWYQAIIQNVEEARYKSDDLEKTLTNFKNTSILELASNPLLVTIIALVHKNASLPHNRAGLYCKAYEIFEQDFFRKWSDSISITKSQLKQILIGVATRIHKDYPSGLIGEIELNNLITKTCKSNNISPDSDFLENFKASIGIIVARGSLLYGFIHLTFQEYLVGVGLVEVQDQALANIISNLDDPRWREPILSALGYIRIKWDDDKQNQLYQQLLSYHDPIGSLIPRIPLFILKAAKENIISSSAIIHEIIDKILYSYSLSFENKLENSIKGPVMAAFNDIFRGLKKDLIINYFCMLIDQHTGRMLFALISIIREKEWFFPEIIKALINNLYKDSKDGGWIINNTLQLALNPDTKVKEPVSPVELSKEELKVLKQENFSAYQERRKRDRIALENYHEKLTQYNEQKNRVPMRNIHIEQLKFGSALECNPHYMKKILNDTFLYQITSVIYGGFFYHGTIDSYKKYDELVTLLHKTDLERDLEIRNKRVYYISAWGADDTIYNIALFLDKRTELDWEETTPVIEPGAIYNDSVLTPQVLKLIAGDVSVTGFMDQLMDIWYQSKDKATQLDILMTFLLDKNTGAKLDTLLYPELYEPFCDKIQLSVERLKDPVFRIFHSNEVDFIKLIVQLKLQFESLDFSIFFAALAQTYTFYSGRPLLLSIFNNLISKNQDIDIEILSEFTSARFFEKAEVKDLAYHLATILDILNDLSFPRFLETMVQIPVSHSFGVIRNQAKWSPDINVSLPPDIIPIRLIDNILSYTPERIKQSMRHSLIVILLRQSIKLIELEPAILIEMLIIDYKNHDFSSGLALATYAEKIGLPKHVFDKQLILAKINNITSDYYRARALIRLSKYESGSSVQLLNAALDAASKIDDPFRKFEILSYLSKELQQNKVDLYEHINEITDTKQLTYAAIELASIDGFEKAEQYLVKSIPAITDMKEQLAVFRCLEILFPDNPGIRKLQVESTLWLNNKAWQLLLNHRYEALFSLMLQGKEGLLSDNQKQIWPLFLLSGKLAEASHYFIVKDDDIDALWKQLPRDPIAVAEAIYNLGINDGLVITKKAAQSIHHFIEKKNITPIVKLLPLLENPATDARPIVTEWLSDEQFRSFAILILREEKRDFLAGELTAIMPLLMSSDDRILLRAGIMIHTNAFGTMALNDRIFKASSIDKVVLLELARQSIYWVSRSPFLANQIGLYYDRVLFDDIAFTEELCNNILLKGPIEEESKVILCAVNYISQEVAGVLVQYFAHDHEILQEAILITFALCSSGNMKERHIDEQWELIYNNINKGTYKINEQLLSRTILTDDLIYSLAVITDRANETGPDLPLSEIREIAAEVMKKITPTIREIAEQQLLSTLPRIIAQQYYVKSNYLLKYSSISEMVADQPHIFSFVLEQIEIHAQKKRNRFDDVFNPLLTHYLLIAATVVRLNQSSYNNYNNINALTGILKRLAKYDRRFVNRYSAITLLGYCQETDIETLEIFINSLYDDIDTRNAAEDAIERVKNADEWVIDKLLRELGKSNGTTALNIAGILTSLGRSSKISMEKRNEIMQVLTACVLNNEYNKPIYRFSGTGWKTNDDELKITYQGDLREKIYDLLLRLNGFNSN